MIINIKNKWYHQDSSRTNIWGCSKSPAFPGSHRPPTSTKTMAKKDARTRKQPMSPASGLFYRGYTENQWKSNVYRMSVCIKLYKHKSQHYSKVQSHVLFIFLQKMDVWTLSLVYKNNAPVVRQDAPEMLPSDVMFHFPWFLRCFCVFFICLCHVISCFFLNFERNCHGTTVSRM